jgi:hypothetical protein
MLLLLHQHSENKSHQLSPPKAMTYIQNTHDHHRQFYRKQNYFETTQTLTLNCNKNIAAFSCTECNNNSFQNQFKHQMEGSSDTLTKPPLSRYSPREERNRMWL